MVRSLSVAVTQMACSASRDKNIARASELVEETASKGAQLVLPQDSALRLSPNFC